MYRVSFPSVFFFHLTNLIASKKRPAGYWLDIENRKKFFVKLATEIGLNPSDPECWYDVSYKDVLSRKVALERSSGIIIIYANSMR